MTIMNPPGWLQNAGDTHTAAQLRTYVGALLSGTTGASGDTLRPNGGVHPELGTEFAVTQAGSPNMTVLVGSGVVIIPGNLSNPQGMYFVANDASVTLSISAAHGSLSRIDLVVVNVRDSFYSGADDDAQLQIITGTPASSPSAPTAPDNSITLAQVLVGPGVTTITNGVITDTRFYFSAVGGVMKVINEAARPGTLNIGEGQLVWTADNNKLWIWDGSAYDEIWPNDWTTWTPTLTNITQGTGTITARYRKQKKTGQFRFKFKLNSGSAIGTSPRISLPFTLHASYVTLEDGLPGTVMLYDSGTANFIGTLRIINSTTV